LRHSSLDVMPNAGHGPSISDGRSRGLVNLIQAGSYDGLVAASLQVNLSSYSSSLTHCANFAHDKPLFQMRPSSCLASKAQQEAGCRLKFFGRLQRPPAKSREKWDLRTRWFLN
jgi:hypothetical protein